MSEVTESSITDKERLDYAWKHFALVADQRIKTFNFYIIILAAAVSGTISAMSPKVSLSPEQFRLMGVAHMLIALVFFLIDLRGCRILAIVSDALAEIEESPAFRDCKKLILEDRFRNKQGTWQFISYRWSFGITFAAQFLFGFLLLCDPFVFRYNVTS